MSDERKLNCCCGQGRICPTHGPGATGSELAPALGSENFACVVKYGRTCGQAGLRFYEWCNDCIKDFNRRAASSPNDQSEPRGQEKD